MTTQDPLVILPLPREAREGFARYSCRLIGHEAGGAEGSILFYEVPGDLTDLHPGDCDAFLLASVMLAMRENRTLRVEGTVSHQLLENLEELMHAWVLWKPHRYSAVKIEARELTAANRYPDSSPSAVAAFSGGVDATHLVWNWVKCRPRPSWYPLRRVVFIHGFDIMLSDPSYGGALEEGRETLGSLDLTLDSIRTNFREVIEVAWPDICGIALASCLHFYKADHARGLIASSAAYHFLIIPWGTTPILDPLTSSHEFRVTHEGCGVARTGKIGAISNWPEGIRNLRVCWQRKGPGRNCGVCEKCVRTKLSLRALGIPTPATFGDELSATEIRGVKIGNDAIYREHLQILEHGRLHGADQVFLSSYNSALSKYRWRRRFLNLRALMSFQAWRRSGR